MQVGIFIQLTGTVLLALLALLVRLWFDLAKVRAVAQNERGMWRNMWKACDMTWRHSGHAVLDVLSHQPGRLDRAADWVLIWTKLPPTAVPATFVLLELMILVQLATRLWQLASITTWYQRHAELVPADACGLRNTVRQPKSICRAIRQPPESLPDR